MSFPGHVNVPGLFLKADPIILCVQEGQEWNQRETGSAKRTNNATQAGCLVSLGQLQAVGVDATLSIPVSQPFVHLTMASLAAYSLPLHPTLSDLDMWIHNATAPSLEYLHGSHILQEQKLQA